MLEPEYNFKSPVAASSYEVDKILIDPLPLIKVILLSELAPSDPPESVAEPPERVNEAPPPPAVATTKFSVSAVDDNKIEAFTSLIPAPLSISMDPPKAPFPPFMITRPPVPPSALESPPLTRTSEPLTAADDPAAIVTIPAAPDVLCPLVSVTEPVFI